MNLIQAFIYLDRIMMKQSKGKIQPDIDKEITRKLIDVHLKEDKEEIDQSRSLIWKEFEKQGKKQGIQNMKKKVYKWLGREKSDIREKIEEKRMEYMRKLKEHKRIMKEIDAIKRRNEEDGRFMPLLEEAREKNRVMLQLNYKDHINKVLKNKMENYWKRCMKENRNGKRKIKRMIREANRQRNEIIQEQQDFQEVFGLYGQEAYLQNEEDPIRVMDAIFETWKDIGRPGMKYFKENMIREIETSFTYQIIEEIVTRLEKEIEEESANSKQIEKKRLEVLYDYYCWNLKLISTDEFYTNIKRYEEII
jgi:hypothetical protein